MILIGSDRRLDLMRGLLDRSTDVYTVDIGTSPITGDVNLNAEFLREIIREMKG